MSVEHSPANRAPASARAFICGGTPSPHDLEVIQEFAAALQQPTERAQRLALA